MNYFPIVFVIIVITIQLNRIITLSCLNHHSKEFRQYQKALSKIVEITTLFDCINDLQSDYLLFKRMKHCQFKEAFKSYCNYLSNVKKVNNFESEFIINHCITNPPCQDTDYNQVLNYDNFNLQHGHRHNIESHHQSIPQDYLPSLKITVDLYLKMILESLSQGQDQG